MEKNDQALGKKGCKAAISEKQGILIRKYRPEDLSQIAELFIRTVHSVCSRDYSPEQRKAWTGSMDLSQWNRSLLEHVSLVAVAEGSIVGFGDMDSSDYLDRLYVHKDHQGQGIATMICDQLEGRASGGRITVHASITGRPFFVKRGYVLIREQQVERKGVWLANYVMEKVL